MNAKADEKRLTVRLDPDVAAALQSYLDKQGRLAPSRAALVSEAVMRWIMSQKDRAA